MKNIDFKTIPAKFKHLIQKVRPYVVLLFFVTIAILFSFLVFRINTLANKEPSDDAVQEKLKTVQRPKIDKDAIAKIQQLQDNSSNVQALFKQARDNPFQE